MSAKIIVVIEYQDLAVASMAVSEELRGRQAGDTSPNHHQVIGRLCLLFGQTKRPALACQCVSHFIGAIHTAPHASERGRVIVRAQ